MIKTSSQFYKSDKIMDLDMLHTKVKELQRQGKKVGLCSGSFDLLHAGHITHLESARKKCDALIVSVASDVYNVQKTKRRGRPIYNEQVRAYCVSQLESVDFVVFNDGEDIPIINKVNPDIYIKGADYSQVQLPSAQVVLDLLKSKGKTWAFTEDEKLSTSDIIEYIKKEIE